MKNHLLTLAAALAVALSFICFDARAAKEVNNGAGLSEQNIVYAYMNVSSVLANCLRTDICALSAGEKAAVKAKIAPIEEQRVQLLFENTTTLGDSLFVIEGTLWKINGDLLWKDSQRTISLDMADALALLFKISDQVSAPLDPTVIEKISAYMRSTVEMMSYDFGNIVTLHVLFLEERARLVLRANEGAAVDLTERLRTLAPVCNSPMRITSPVFQAAEKIGVDAENVHFLLRIWSDCTAKATQIAVTIRILATPKDGNAVEVTAIEGLAL